MEYPSIKALIINCENSAEWRNVSFADMFRTGLQQSGDVWETCNVAAGAKLPVNAATSYDAFVITGSYSDCRDGKLLPWFDSVCDLIREVAMSDSGNAKMFGGCFGCQIVAHALGGTVNYNPGQRVHLKAETINIVAVDQDKSLACIDKDHMQMIKAHGDCVTQLPPNSTLLASSSTCCNEIYVTGATQNILCCQSHPEFDYKYCIVDRIWPLVVDQQQKLSEQEIIVAKASFDTYTGDDATSMMKSISLFLRQRKRIQ